MIQLSDHRIHAQQQSEPRMEAIVYVGRTDQLVRSAHTKIVSGDLLGAVRDLKEIERMTPVAYAEIDRLTLQFGHPEDVA